jgi:hypothetical protein
LASFYDNHIASLSLSLSLSLFLSLSLSLSLSLYMFFALLTLLPPLDSSEFEPSKEGERE